MSGDAARPKVVSRLVSFVPYIPATGFVVDLLIRLFGGVDDWQETALEVGVLWLIGVNGMILGSGHLLMPRPVAEGIGWPTSPFQWEVGLAGVSYGVLGVTASGFEREYTLAAIIAFSISCWEPRSVTSGPWFATATSHPETPATSSGTTSLRRLC